MDFINLFFKCVAALLIDNNSRSSIIELFEEGLFVSEASVDRELAEKVHQEDPTTSSDEAKLKIYKSFEWKWVYLIRGTECVPGLLLSQSQIPENLISEKIHASYKIEDAQNTISSRDPFFKDNATCRPLIHFKYLSEIKLFDSWYKLEHNAFNRFSNLYDSLSCVKGLRKANEAHTNSPARDRLRVFQKLFQKSEPVEIINHEITQRMRHRGQYIYRRYRELLFIIESSNKAIEEICTSYDIFNEPSSEECFTFNAQILFKVVATLLEANKNPSKLIRITQDGIFLAYKWITRFIQEYHQLDNNKSRHEIKKLLWQSTKGEIAYLIDGDNCVFGILIPALEIVQAIGWRSLDEVVSGAASLLADDPIFHEGTGIGLPVRSKCLARFKVGDGLYHVSIHAFNRFIEKGSNNPRLRKMKGFDLVNRRGYLALLYHLFHKSQPVLRNNALLQFLKHKFRKASYRTYAGWLFVILADNTIITLFPVADPLKSGYQRIIDNDEDTSA